MLIDYTTYDQIRAALGVDDEDLPDSVVSLPLYESILTQEFEDIDLDIETTYATTEALETPTAQETRFLTACDLFATYAVAKHLSAALPLFAAHQVTDGKAQINRFTDPYKDVVAQVLSQYERAKSRLIAALSAIGTTNTSTAKAYFAIIPPSVDPVTGS